MRAEGFERLLVGRAFSEKLEEKYMLKGIKVN